MRVVLLSGLFAIAAVVALALIPTHRPRTAVARETPRSSSVTPPCKGCTLDVPERDDRADGVPLVVVLHGDKENADDAAARWRQAVTERGWALLGIDCPRHDGCPDSFWKWNGDPDYIFDAVTGVAKRVRVDPRRIFLVGWSGGATYIGLHAPVWSQAFAAIVIHGGGIAPKTDDCPEHLPAYFLVGNENPAHPGSKRLRDYLSRCKQEVTWDLLEGADHQAEKESLTTKKAHDILTWLERHRAVRAPGLRSAAIM